MIDPILIGYYMIDSAKPCKITIEYIITITKSFLATIYPVSWLFLADSNADSI